MKGQAPLLAVVPVLAVVAATGCATGPPPLPSRPVPVPYADTLPIPEPPEREERRYVRTSLVHLPHDLSRPLRTSEGEALNRTRFDEVVPSAWFEPRMGHRDLTPRDVARGATSPGGAPATEGPLVVLEGKSEGVTPGFTLEDRKGDVYIVKFDAPDHLHMQSAAGVITNRLMWAAGYHVPEDYLLVFDSARLQVAEDAEIEAQDGERRMTQDDVRAVLEGTGPLPDGRFIALASRFVPGIPKGPFFMDGRREDDPNDHYRHEYRRELRGLRVVSSWVNNTDMREGNTLDVYVEPGYLRHYIIDFGATLGSSSTRPKHPKDEMEQPSRLWPLLGRFVTLGAYKAGWEDDPAELIDPAVGYIRGESFDPESWYSHWDNAAFAAMTPADAYWAAKIVAAFGDEHIRAAVETGGLPRRELVDTLVRILSTRRDRIVATWFAKVSPVEEPAVAAIAGRGLELAFQDLGLATGAWSGDATEYRWTFRHEAVGRRAAGVARAGPGPRQRIPVRWQEDAQAPEVLDDGEALARVEIQVRRPGVAGRPATVWLHWTGEAYEVVALEH